MNRQVKCLFVGTLLLCMAGIASASIVGYWPLDGDANDLSGNGLHGTVVTADPDGDPNWVLVGEGPGQALSLVGVNDYVNIDGYKGILATDGVQAAFSIAAWIKSTADGEILTWGINGLARRNTFRINGDGLRAEHSSGNLRGRTMVRDGEWHHAGLTVVAGGNLRPENCKLYIDGLEETEYFSGGSTRYNLTAGPDMHIGNMAYNNTRWFPGIIDEVHFYSRVLDPNQMMEVMNGAIASWPDAGDFSPGNGSLVEATWVALSWGAGDGADSHNVYFGTSEDLGPDQLVSSQTEIGFDVTDLAQGQTYYWRIDEVQAVQDANDLVFPGALVSFTVPVQAAYDPSPENGTVNAIVSSLSWTGGWSPLMHAVYVTDAGAGAINNGSVEPTILIRDASLAVGLEAGTTYFWAVDEFYGDHWALGDILSFSTAPNVAADPNADPSLVAYWTFDEEAGSTALDMSGNNYHAALINGIERVESGAGEGSGNALNFTDNDQYGAISGLVYETSGIPEVTVFAWIRTAISTDQYILSYDRNEYYRLEINGLGGGDGQVGWDVWTDAGQIDYGSEKRVDDDEWHHVAGVFDKGTATIFIDGVAEPSVTLGTTMGTGNRRFGFIASNSEATSYDGANSGGGSITYLDELKIFSRAFSADEMRNMFTNVAQALDPDPANGATVLPGIVGLTFTPGEGAVSHNVYLSENDFDSVNAGADSVFVGNVVNPAILLGIGIPPDPFVGGLTPGATYFWRIDEVDADGNVAAGKVWSFTLSL